ncbi:MAG TPA: magnesium transporter [Phycisphaerae bacterium]|nr:magnesium transporter [Phycisphaerae bacterium]HRW51247.1 magnesium transporter [Phycisphaerae bacterium]
MQEPGTTSVARRQEDLADLVVKLRQLLTDGDDDQLRAFLAELHAADVADCLEAIDEEDRSRLLFLLPPRTVAVAIDMLEESVRSDVLDGMPSAEVSKVLKELPADDAVDVLDEMDDERADSVVEHLPPKQRAAVEMLRQFDEDSAGGIMNTDFVSVPVTATAADAIARIRKLSEERRLEVYYVYCVDEEGRLLGVVPPMRLITAPAEMPLEKLMLDELFTAHVEDDQEEVKNKFDKYDVVALPVTDSEQALVGVITHDDVLEVAEEEAEEDIFHMAGTDAEEFASSSILRAASIRARWLLPSLIGTFSASMITLYFKEQMEEQIFSLLIPFLIPIAAMGGNVGVQISTVIVRALATGDVMASRFSRAAYRELRIALVVSVGAAMFASSGAFAITNSGAFVQHGGAAAVPLGFSVLRLAMSVGLAMVVAVMLSGTLGLTLPFLFRRIGIDPAIATGPLITTMNDAVSACVYLSIAMGLLA